MFNRRGRGDDKAPVIDDPQVDDSNLAMRVNGYFFFVANCHLPEIVPFYASVYFVFL